MISLYGYSITLADLSQLLPSLKSERTAGSKFNSCSSIMPALLSVISSSD